MKFNRFATYAWGALLYNILVILWGAYVRATGSGAGCGNHWPSCNGEVVPLAAQSKTLIEFGHRLSSGLALIGVIILLIWAFCTYPKKHTVRLGAMLSMVFIVVEALIGAGLVLFELVAENTSLARAVVIAIHLANTFLLLGSLTLTAWWASGGQPVQLKRTGWPNWALALGFIGLLILGSSGAVTALGDTLFPAASLAEGLQEKFSPTAHFLVRLRLLHPMIAIGVGGYLILIAGIFNILYATLYTRRIVKLVTILYLIQLAVGALNIVLLAPIWMQLFHLLLSDLIFIVWTLFAAASFAQDAPYAQSDEILKVGPSSAKEAYGQSGH